MKAEGELFEVATQIAEPLGLAGLFAVIFFYVLKQVIARSPTVRQAAWADVLRLTIRYLFILSLVAMVLGFLGYVIKLLVPRAGVAAAPVTSLPRPTPSPAMLRAERVLIASNIGFEVVGCESRTTWESVAAPGRVDISKPGQGGAPAGFELVVRGNNRHGVRNALLAGDRTLKFDAFANGPGTVQGILGCVGGQGANVSVDVYAWVFKQ